MAENDREDLMAEFFVMPELEEGEVLLDEDTQKGLDQVAEEEITVSFFLKKINLSFICGKFLLIFHFQGFRSWGIRIRRRNFLI